MEAPEHGEFMVRQVPVVKGEIHEQKGEATCTAAGRATRCKRPKAWVDERPGGAQRDERLKEEQHQEPSYKHKHEGHTPPGLCTGSSSRCVSHARTVSRTASRLGMRARTLCIRLESTEKLSVEWSFRCSTRVQNASAFWTSAFARSP